MKILIISNCKDKFSLDSINYTPINIINKNNLLGVIDLFLNSEC